MSELQLEDFRLTMKVLTRQLLITARRIELSSKNPTWKFPSITRSIAASAMVQDPFKPAKRVAGQRQDVWSIVNEAAQASSVTPMVNMGQGFFGYNPPDFCIQAAKDALDKVECNQYSPTKVSC
jgi:hypothetical protein